MKKLYTLITLIATIATYAQAPQGFNYQATVRNSAGALIVNQNVYFKFNVMLNSATSVPVYSETHYVPTDDLGQVNLVVGTGTPTTGTFAGINWASGTYYLGIELNTGTGYVAMGTTQLLSVPYALHANTANSTTVSTGGFTHYVGELFGGGIVVSVYKDTAGTEHGLIASLTDVGTSVWSNVETEQIGILAESGYDGMTNTISIINQTGHTTSAAKLCYDYTAGGFDDWYLPALWELNECYNSATKINQVLGNINGFKLLSYWSSSEFGFNSAYCKPFAYGGSGIGKSAICNVRAVRRF